jgi:hypothetical protein
MNIEFLLFLENISVRTAAAMLQLFPGVEHIIAIIKKESIAIL